jgi:predicted DNA-binding transcriptional regulator AlpA
VIDDYDSDFPTARELVTHTDDQLRDFVRAGGMTDGAVREEMHRRHPTLRMVDALRTKTFYEDMAGMNLLLLLDPGPRWKALSAAYDALLARIVHDDDTALRQRPTLTADQCAELAGCQRSTFEGYVARGQAPARIGFDFGSGAAVWDTDVINAWQRHRPGAGSRSRG